MKKTKSKLEWFKKNIVIVPVVAAIIAGTFTSVRYVLSLTDTITANQQEIVDLTRDLKQAQKNIADQNTRLSSAEATWTMAENLNRYRCNSCNCFPRFSSWNPFGKSWISNSIPTETLGIGWNGK